MHHLKANLHVHDGFIFRGRSHMTSRKDKREVSQKMWPTVALAEEGRGDFACVVNVHYLLFKPPTICNVSSCKQIKNFVYVPGTLVANNPAKNIFVQFYFTPRNSKTGQILSL